MGSTHAVQQLFFSTVPSDYFAQPNYSFGCFVVGVGVVVGLLQLRKSSDVSCMELFPATMDDSIFCYKPVSVPEYSFSSVSLSGEYWSIVYMLPNSTMSILDPTRKKG